MIIDVSGSVDHRRVHGRHAAAAPCWRLVVLRPAVRMLRLPELELDYEAARVGWESSADGQAGDAATGDGIVAAAP